MSTETLKAALCRHFRADVLVRETADGLAVSTGIVPDAGDRIGFGVVETDGGHYLADDGDFLASLDADGIDIGTGGRRQFLDGILRSAGAFWDRDTFVIRTEVKDGAVEPAELIAFMTALIRVRDIRFWTREAIRSTFKQDVTAAIQETLANVANINVEDAVDKDLAEFPADVVVRPKEGMTSTAVYLVSTNDGLNEALALWQEANRLGRTDVKVMAIVEDEQGSGLNRRKLQRMANRIDSVAYYRGDEKAAIDRVRRTAGVGVAANH